MKIRYSRRNNHYLTRSVMLKPGLNDVEPTPEVEAALKSKVGQALIAEKVISLVDDEPAVEPTVVVPADLSSMNAPEAIAVVQSMKDAEALLGLIDKEERKTVKEAIEKRVEELTAE